MHVATTVLSSVVLMVLATKPRNGRLVDATCVEKARAVEDSIMINATTKRAIVMVNGDEWIPVCLQIEAYVDVSCNSWSRKVRQHESSKDFSPQSRMGHMSAVRPF